MSVRKFGFLILASLACWSGIGYVFGQDAPSRVVKGKAPEERLSEIRAELKNAAETLQKAESATRRYRHDILYTNQHINVLYKEMRALEMQAAEKRKALDTEIQKDPKYRELMRQRNASHKKVRELRDLERLFLKRAGEPSGR